MRRKEKEISDIGKIEEVIDEAFTCRVALCRDNMPYVVSVNFGYQDNCLYFHSAREGRKIDMIRANNNVCFEMDCDTTLVVTDTACDWSFNYKSVIGFGKATIVDDPEAKRRALDIIMRHYSDKTYSYRDDSIAKIYIVKIEIESMTGKQSQPQ